MTSMKITWTSNNTTSQITTGNGPARTGMWGFFVIPHGNDTGGPFDPQEDGFIGSAAETLFGVGGWLTSNTGGGGAQVQFRLDGNPVGFTDSWVTYYHKFFGVIDTRGFNTFEVLETEGVIEDQKFIFADDFTIATLPKAMPWILLLLLDK
jgi:hypothetical protein